MTEQNLTPPLPVPGFLQSHPVKVWCSPAGLWFLRSAELQTGGILQPGSADRSPVWLLHCPTDEEEWQAVLQRLADDLEQRFGGPEATH